MPKDPDGLVWVIEFQARFDANICHRLVIEMGLVGKRHPAREVRPLPQSAQKLRRRHGDADLRSARGRRLAIQADDDDTGTQILFS